MPGMRIIAVGTLRDYWIAHPDAKKPLQAWVEEVRAAQWRSPADVKAAFRSASILPGRRVVFNIKGNDHRLVVAIAYLYSAAYIKFVGTHSEYDLIDVRNVEP